MQLIIGETKETNQLKNLPLDIWDFWMNNNDTWSLRMPGRLPSGNLLHSYWTWPFLVDLPIENGDFL